MFPCLPDGGHLMQGQVTSDKACIQTQDLTRVFLFYQAACLTTYNPPPRSVESLRMGCIVPFTSEEAEVTEGVP